ncbi:ATP-binding protein [Mobiluncus mulieris]|uniref:ATP-binding protein n=1 Tax=Mobiluncus mulieris TaxID=2052 RepID=UPI002092242C|nr:ATP-binding protein [Mobiluncus mulieris]
MKTGANGIPGLGQTLCAFANMPDGGTIIIGVSETWISKCWGLLLRVSRSWNKA